MRYENKFILPAYQYDDICFKVLTSSFWFSEIFEQRTVNNIYLDTVDLHHFHENITGAPNRLKHRIRWYGTGLNVTNPVLEYKIKQGEVGYKHLFALPEFSLTDFDYHRYISDMESHVDLHDHRNRIMCNELSMEAPTLLNSYSRRYFLSHDGNYRITLDDHINYKDTSRGFDSSFSFTENKIVLELKYEREHAEHAHRIVQELGCRVSKNSKYVTGVNSVYFNVFPR